jgi:uncharacterized protein with NRDE domain
MCTLVAAVGQFEGSPLVIAANRDERLDRPATPPRLWPAEMPFLAPRDEIAGGTWLGLNAAGLFVGITNRFGAQPDPTRESRGKIVLEALRSPSAAALHRQLASIGTQRFNAFHLLYADPTDAFVSWFDGQRFAQAELGRGVHIVTERSLGGDDRARTETVRAAWKGIEGQKVPDVDRLEALLRIHREDDPVGGTCVHLPSLRYGTRSSLVLLGAAELSGTRFFWAEAPPCEAPFVEQTGLMRALVGATRPPSSPH